MKIAAAQKEKIRLESVRHVELIIRRGKALDH